MSKRKKRLIVFLAGLGLIVGCVALHVLIIAPYLESRLVDRLLTDFEACPGPPTAEPLLKLLASRSVSNENGTRILKVLLAPEVELVEPCVAGTEIRIIIRHKHDLGMPKGLVACDLCALIVKGDGVDYVEANSQSVKCVLPWTSPRPDIMIEPPCLPEAALVIHSPGVYRARLELQCFVWSEPDLWPGTYSPTAIFWPPPPPPTSVRDRIVATLRTAWERLRDWWYYERRGWIECYYSTFEIPLEINVRPATRAGSEGDQQ